jgi:hypothetical protein
VEPKDKVRTTGNFISLVIFFSSVELFYLFISLMHCHRLPVCLEGVYRRMYGTLPIFFCSYHYLFSILCVTEARSDAALVIAITKIWKAIFYENLKYIYQN